ncbi:helix-turn-helix transcriptional regulator [Aminobacter aminovorans]|uniref:helix-turn-helix domain-containing protein n=1 Tax=Aminobacter aminovorans TaxID=83263 RepID=UPI00285B7BD1|nr:helix-turn-helix transcriptional regulator [Aminobacter aminovorans]MDR7220328.1 transcriptional regulator with XRE-family HTH domain [Aminobacter aminovorans]
MATKSVLDIDITVGRNVRRLRNIAKMSQTDLAPQIGVTFQQLQKYENGTNRVSASKLVLISRALACGLPALFEGVEGGSERRATAHSAEALRAATLFDQVPAAQRAAFIGLLSSMAGSSHG